MSTTLSKTYRKGVHVFSIDELYHAWVNRDEYGKNKTSSRNTVSFAFGYLCHSDVLYNNSRFKSKDDIISNFNLLTDWNNNSKLIGIINHKRKLVIVTDKWNYSYALFRAIPDNYKIIRVNDYISNPRILEPAFNKELALMKAKTIVEDWVNNSSRLFQALDSPNLLTIQDWWFTRDNRIKPIRKEAYAHKFNNLTVDIYKGWSFDKKLKVRPISVKDIIEHKVFTKKEVDKLHKCNFYQHCYGWGITKKDINENYNKTCDFKYASKWLNRLYTKNDIKDYSSCVLWQDYIRTLIDKLQERDIKWSEELIAKGEYNKAKAITEANSQCSVIDWRNGKHFESKSVEYRYPHIEWANNHIKCVTWQTLYETPIKPAFSTIQFRIPNFIPDKLWTLEGYNVETSLGVKLPLAGAIKRFNVLLRSINILRNKEDNKKFIEEGNDFKYIVPFNKEANFGPFRIREINYKDNPITHEKDWNIVIGCHSMWLEDIKNFVWYYSLNQYVHIEIIDDKPPVNIDGMFPTFEEVRDNIASKLIASQIDTDKK